MSVKISAQVWANYPNGGGELLTALALAEHADPEGGSIFPSLERVAWMSRQSVRTVRRHIRGMEKSGLLVMVELENQHRPREYRFNLDILGIHRDQHTRSGKKEDPKNQGGQIVRADTSDTQGGHSSVRRSVIDPSVVNKQLEYVVEWDPNAWDDYQLHRKKIGKSLDKMTETGLESLIKEIRRLISDTGLTMRELVDYNIRNGYQGFFAPKVGAVRNSKNALQRGADSIAAAGKRFE